MEKEHSLKLCLTVVIVGVCFMLSIILALAISLPMTLCKHNSPIPQPIIHTETSTLPIHMDRYNCSLVDYSAQWSLKFTNVHSNEYRKFTVEFETFLDDVLTAQFEKYSVSVNVLQLWSFYNKTQDANYTLIDFLVSIAHEHELVKPVKDELQSSIALSNANWSVPDVKQLEATCEHGWNYDINGPTEWPSFCPSCNGLRQSPITIWPADVLIDHHLKPLRFDNYDLKIAKLTVADNGHTAFVTIATKTPISLMLPNNQTKWYRLQQIHFHWGFSDNEGSEHSIANTKFPVEIHLVHKYSDSDLAVLALFGEVSCDAESPLLQTITDALTSVASKGQKAALPDRLSIDDFLPSNTESFFSYSGSLTTPPCSEIVEWVILADTVKVNQNTIDQLRKLRDSLTRPLAQNYRSAQALNHRQIRFKGTAVPSYSEANANPQC